MRRNFNFLITVLLTLLSLPMGAQMKYKLIERSNPWNHGRNINGLRTDSVTVSYAQIYGAYERGGFRNVNDGSSQWTAGALAETQLHLEKMSMKGMFRFEQIQGKDMCGTMLIRPENYPVNVVEFTPGMKTRQEYSFEGGLSYALNEHWQIGGEMTFSSMNWAKRKDLRHATYLLDLGVLPSIRYSQKDWNLGMTYVFHKNSESVKAAQIGSSAEEFKVFLDKGLLYGTYENWEGNGVHLKESGVEGFPIQELTHGAAMQFSWHDLYFDIECLYGKGKSGEKETLWFEFPTNQIKTYFSYLLRTPHAHHHFRLEMSYEHGKNYENILDKETEGGITIAHKYASNLISDQEKWQWIPEYELVKKNWNLRWGLILNDSKIITSQKYPYICTWHQFDIDTHINGQVAVRRWNFGAQLGFSKSIIHENMRTSSDPGKVEAPYRVEAYANQWLDYHRAPKLESGLYLRYCMGKGLYATLSGKYLNAIGVRTMSEEYLNNILDAHRWSLAAQMVYEF